MYAKSAYADIRRRRTAWPHKYIETTLTVQPGQRDYFLSSLGAGNFETVTEVISDRLGSMPIFPRGDMLSAFGFENPNQAASMYVSVGPQYISFYPVPQREEPYRVRGYSVFNEWPSGDASPDLPRDFDLPICWALCRDYYLSQEETEMALLYDSRYENDVDRMIRNLGQSFGAYASPKYFTATPPRGLGRRTGRHR
jgi:hypothetical protein